MLIVFDANILLDAFLAREHGPEAMFLLDQAHDGLVQGAVTPTVLTTTFYVGGRYSGSETVLEFVQEMLAFLEVVPVTRSVLQRAADRYVDFEDGVIGEGAFDMEADVVCTRNTDDSAPCRVRVATPWELVRELREDDS